MWICTVISPSPCLFYALITVEIGGNVDLYCNIAIPMLVFGVNYSGDWRKCGFVLYYCDGKNKKKYISKKNKDFIQKLAQRDYSVKIKVKIDKMLKELQNIYRHNFYDEICNVYNNMSDAQHFSKAIEKIGLYERNGIYLGEDIIVTFESENNNFNAKDLNNIINHFLV